MSSGATVARLADAAEPAVGRGVLFVEDSAVEARLVRAALRHAGITDVTWVATLKGALAVLHRRSFACVVLDLGLPDADGLEALDAALTVAGGTPVVVLTGRDDRGLAREAVRRGADDYLLKSELATRLLDRAVNYAIERGEARAALKKREAQFRAILESLGEGLVVQDASGRIQLANAAASRILGRTADDLMERGWDDLLGGSMREDGSPFPRNEHPAMVALRSGRDVGGVVVGGHKPDGTLVWIEVDSRPWLTPNGRPYAVLTSFRDVSDRRRAEESSRSQKIALEHSERQLAEAQAIAHVGSWEWDVEQGTLRWSAELYRIFGQDPASFEPSLDALFSCVHGDDRRSVEENLYPALERGANVRCRYRIVRPGGEVRWLDSSWRALVGGPEGPFRYVGIAFDVTDRHVAVERLRDSEQRYRSIVETAREGVWVTDGAGLTTFVNRRMADLLGRTVGEMVGSHVFEHMDGEAIALWEQNVTNRDGGGRDQVDYKLLRKDGAELWVAMATSPHFDGGTLAMVTDVTGRHHAEAARRESEARLAEAQRVAHLGSWSLDCRSGAMAWSDEQYRLFGYEPGEVEPSAWAMLARVHPEDAGRIRAAMDSEAACSSLWEGEARVTSPNGMSRWVSVRIEPVHDDGGAVAGLNGTTQDVTARKEVELELAHLALHDPLTGLPNRSLLRDRLDHALGQSERGLGLVAVLFLDIDRFKFVNDSRGHPVGDELLKGVARRIELTVRPGDTVARFGGDEFVVVCEGVSDAAEAEAIAQRLARSFDSPFPIEGEEVFASASVGVAVGTADDAPDALLSAADAAMYRAKGRGRGQTALFDASLRDRAEFQLVGEAALRRAIEAGHLDVVYQPVVSLASDDVVGVEALIRWNHPEKGVLNPGDFIPLAEESGLIAPLGALVLERACRELSGWQARQPDLYLAVNVSARQLAVPEFLPALADVLARHEVDPGSVVLEVTETVLMDDAEFFLRVLRDLKALGVKIAIDDFGTGYSSLNYLRLFPLDALKVDRRFVEGVADSAQDASIVAAVLGIADALDVDTVAEGVETEAQLTLLRRLGCRYAQGYHFARPLPAAEMGALLDGRPNW